ncbi:hypothetical protein EMPS_10410 [Entomortierella parvispora]|uniref:Uncharacterized protein n=1 Tax=Entomortierella parvispora TaxID=205924 RepID=A0A9P3HK26_9FUNG|nr:hypothetical protein EMPS_10410 [Entomortierella parvispora]
MASAIAPPASLGLVSGSAFSSASPAVLEQMLDTLDVESLEKELERLQRATQQLVQSNKEIEEFIELEQQDLLAHHQNQKELGLTNEEHSSVEPDPEFVLAIEENKEVIEKYERTCVHLKTAIQKKRGVSSAQYGSVESTAQGETEAEVEGGVFL